MTDHARLVLSAAIFALPSGRTVLLARALARPSTAHNQ
jgi:hypothetical protein